MTSPLPEHPNLKQLRHQAKDLVKSHKRGDASCCRILRHLNRFNKLDDADILASNLSLVEAQFSVALDYGFKGWAQLKNHVQDAAGAAPGHLKMPAPGKEPGNTYARGLAAVLSYLGHDVGYEDLMGLTGVAFGLQVDPAGPMIDGELDCAWWPNDAWGFRKGLPLVSRAIGRELRVVHHDWSALNPDPAAAFDRWMKRDVMSTLAEGRPVLAECDHAFVITAMDEEEPPLLGYGTRGKSTQFEETLRASMYPCGLILPGKEQSAASSREVDQASLTQILKHFHSENENASTWRSGRAAWNSWLELQRAGTGCDNNMLIHLRYNRSSAVAYLRSMASRYSGELQSYLNRSVDHYQEAVNLALAQGLPWNRVQKGEEADTVRAEYTAMCEQIFEHEKLAMNDLENALHFF